MKIFIHAGTFKTGSSALQDSLYKQREKLLENRVLFPLAGISKNGESIGYRHSRFVYEHGKASYQKLLSDLKSEIEVHRPEKLILSSEAWSRPGAAVKLFDLISHLQPYSTEEISVIFVVRNVFDYAVSHYREFVRRWGWSTEFHEYLTKRFAFFDYNKLFKPFLEKGIKVEFLNYSQSVTQKIIETMGLECLLVVESADRKNVGLSAPDIEIYRIINSTSSARVRNAVPSFQELLEKMGLSAEHSKYIEGPPPFEFRDRFDEKYQQTFAELTGLPSHLLDYDRSRFREPGIIWLSKVKPIISHYFDEGPLSGRCDADSSQSRYECLEVENRELKRSLDGKEKVLAKLELKVSDLERRYPSARMKAAIRGLRGAVNRLIRKVTTV
uniref:hypothetical protein n=1 Tax=Microbulbifer agarilyticus TaxID=260552 RepID=UPI000255BB3B|nr:hypothetical protein [Microbulbifer agarilyticus]